MRLTPIISTIFIVFFLSIGSVEANRLTDEENRILQAECGKTVNISDAGGMSAERMKAPWLINYRNGNLSCSGVLISKKHFLTARHCLTKNITTPSSSNKACTTEKHFLLQLSDLKLEIGSEKVFNADARLFEFCKENTQHYVDIAVIELSEGFELSEALKPVRISKEDVQSGNPITISSFGYSKSNSKAGKHPSRAGRVFATANMEIGTATSEHNVHEATGWSTAGTRAGDSGSGAVVQKSGRYFLAGIVSRKNTKSIVMDIPRQAAKICNIYNICS